MNFIKQVKDTLLNILVWVYLVDELRDWGCIDRVWGRMSEKWGHLCVLEVFICIYQVGFDQNLSIFGGGMWFPFQILVKTKPANTNNCLQDPQMTSFPTPTCPSPINTPSIMYSVGHIHPN